MSLDSQCRNKVSTATPTAKQYITAPSSTNTTGYASCSNSNFNFGNNDFTIEFYYYYIPGTGSTTLVSCYTTNNSYDGFILRVNGSGSFIMQNLGIGAYNIGTVTANSWNYLAVTRNLGTVTGYINGIKRASDPATPSTWLNIGGTNKFGNCLNFVIGRDFTSASATGSIWLIRGYIYQIRWTPSVVYNASFTPPTSNLTDASGNCLILAIVSNSVLVDQKTTLPVNIITNNGTPKLLFQTAAALNIPDVF
jgi:hypothetical protein